LAAVSPLRRADGLEPLDLHADAHVAGALFEEHSRRVFAYCLSKLGRREDAEDAVQTTFLHAVRGLRRGVVPTVELAWLLGIARNVCLSRHESAGRRGRLELVCDPVDLERTAARQGRGDELIGIEDALARLPEQQRRAVLLRDWRGLSYEEVATELGVTLANAETLIFRGRRTLAATMQEQPSATRRRLASLGNLGSLFTAIKTAFTGAATVAKIAAAVTVVAASSAGVVAGTSALTGSGDGATKPAGAPTPAPASQAPSADARAARPVSTSVPAGTDIARAGAGGRAPAPAPAGSTTPDARGPAPDAPSPAAEPAPTPAAPASPPAAPGHLPVAAVPKIVDPRPAPLPTVQSTVDDVLPDLPVVIPALPEVVGSLPVPPLPVETPPVVDTVVGAIPPITVTPPVVPVVPIAPIAPVTIDPGTLLP
jgi:RNA polymerase sigma factor (sigma-70 family)